MVGAVAAPIAYLILEPARATGEGLERLVFAAGMAALVLVRHRSNIARLAAGTELRIGGAKKEKGKGSDDPKD